MNKMVAEEVMERLRKANDALNEVCHAIELMPDSEEKRTFRKSIAQIVLDIYEYVMDPIIKQYPEFDPDKVQN